MRSFALTLIATLAFSAFSWAAPVAKRADPVQSLQAIFTSLVAELAPLTQQLEFLNANNATTDVVEPIVDQITNVLTDANTSVEKLVGVPVHTVLATVEGLLTTAEVAQLVGDVINVTVAAAAAVAKVGQTIASIDVVGITNAITTITASLVGKVVTLTAGVLGDVVGAVLPVIQATIPTILKLNVESLIELLGFKL